MLVPLLLIVDLVLGYFSLLVLEFAHQNTVLMFSDFELLFQFVDVHVEFSLLPLFLQYFFLEDILPFLCLYHFFPLLLFILSTYLRQHIVEVPLALFVLLLLCVV